jgi:tRNA A-37 threonylcarbamoyl transferase component Bud32
MYLSLYPPFESSSTDIKALRLDNDSQVLDVTIGGSLLAFENLFWSSKLSQFLDNNTRLKFLSINNEHKTTHADLQNIFQALQRNVTLESLVIRDRFARSSWTGGARDESVEEIDYAKGLSTNISLTKLSLAGVNLSGRIQSLADALRHNVTLRSLSIDDYLLTDQDLHHLYAGLLFNKTLESLTLPEHLETCDSYNMLQDLVAKNKARKAEQVQDEQSTDSAVKDPDQVVLDDQDDLMGEDQDTSSPRSRSEDDQDHPTIVRLEKEIECLKKQLDSSLREIAQLRRENEALKQGNNSYSQPVDIPFEIATLRQNNNQLADIPFHEITIGECIGSGGFGEVFKAVWHGQNVAVKRVKLAALIPSRVDDLRRECQTVMLLHHKHVVLSMGTSVDTNTNEIMLVMEFMKHGSLEDLLFKYNVKLDHPRVIQLALDVAKGLNYLHCLTPKIIHRDLKCANILLYHNKSRAKISDFGTAKLLEDGSKVFTVLGTPSFMAPEILAEEPYTVKADVYSFGVVLFVMMTNKNLPILDEADRVAKIKNMVSDREIAQLIVGCCYKDPSKRFTIREIIDKLKQLRNK